MRDDEGYEEWPDEQDSRATDEPSDPIEVDPSIWFGITKSYDDLRRITFQIESMIDTANLARRDSTALRAADRQVRAATRALSGALGARALL